MKFEFEGSTLEFERLTSMPVATDEPESLWKPVSEPVNVLSGSTALQRANGPAHYTIWHGPCTIHDGDYLILEDLK